MADPKALGDLPGVITITVEGGKDLTGMATKLGQAIGEVPGSGGVDVGLRVNRGVLGGIDDLIEGGISQTDRPPAMAGLTGGVLANLQAGHGKGPGPEVGPGLELVEALPEDRCGILDHIISIGRGHTIGENKAEETVLVGQEELKKMTVIGQSHDTR